MDLRGERKTIVTIGGMFIAVLLAMLLLAATASAEIRSGSATDGAESDRLPPGQDIVAVDASYDTVTGTITAAVTTVGPPEKLADIALQTVFFPVSEDGECLTPEAKIAAAYNGSGASWQYGNAEGSGQKTIAGNTTTLSASSPTMVNQPFFCMNAYVIEKVDDEFERIEYLIPALELNGPPAPPAPPAPPSPPAPAPIPPPAPPKVAALSIGPPKPLTLHRNRWKKVKLTVANTGTATAAKVKLSVGKAPGVAIKPKSGKFELKAIAAGKTASVSLKLRLTKKAKAVSVLPLTVSGAKGVKAEGKIVLKAWHKKKHKPKPGPKPPTPEPASGSLAEKIFYTYDMTDTSHSAYLIGYTFVDDTWAYNGIPSGGLPNCTAVTGTAKKEGCVKYTYDPKTGAVQFGSVTGAKINSKGNFEIDGETYLPLSIPAAGTLYQVEQEFIGFSGMCGSFTGCSTWHEYVTLTGTGEFILTRESLTTSGGSGPGEIFIAAGSYPPDEHGSYVIEPMGRIRLAFADGSVETKTIAVFPTPEGKPDPINEGFILDSTYFTFAHIG